MRRASTAGLILYLGWLAGTLNREVFEKAFSINKLTIFPVPPFLCTGSKKNAQPKLGV